MEETGLTTAIPAREAAKDELDLIRGRDSSAFPTPTP
jgi:hypothetical protein